MPAPASPDPAPVELPNRGSVSLCDRTGGSAVYGGGLPIVRLEPEGPVALLPLLEVDIIVLSRVGEAEALFVVRDMGLGGPVSRLHRRARKEGSPYLRDTDSLSDCPERRR